MVQIGQCERQRLAVALRAREFLRQALVEAAPVGQARQRVLARLAFEGFGLLAQTHQQRGLFAVGRGEAFGLFAQIGGAFVYRRFEIEVVVAQLRFCLVAGA